MTSKQELRKELRSAVASLSDQEKENASGQLSERLRSLSTSSLGIYLSLPDEPDLATGISHHLKAGTPVALAYPKAETDWCFHTITDLSIVETGAYGLSYPKAGPEVSAADLEVILVPGMGFTHEGKRLGRGKGIYDRLLADTTARKIGICFACQMTEDLPCDPWDVRMDEVWIG